MPKLPHVRNPYPALVERVYSSIPKQTGSEPAANVLRMSRIGECVRLLWAERRGLVPPFDPDPRLRAIFRLGSVIEEEVIALVRAAGYPVTGQQKLVSTALGDGYALVGHIDGQLILNQKRAVEWTLLEVKSSNVRRFEELEAVGYEAWHAPYADQLHAYMGAGGFSNALAVVYCKDDSRIYAEKVWLNAERYEALQEKARTALGSERVPARPGEASSEYCAFCKWCAAREWCWSPVPDAAHLRGE